MTKKGFTLVELIIATTILFFLGFSIYQVFSQGVRLWNRASKNRPETEISLFFEKLASDLRNSVKLSGQEFIGSSNGLSFYALGLQDIYHNAKTERVAQPLWIRYEFNRDRTEIQRSQSGYYAILNSGQTPEKIGQMASHVVGCKYAYLKRDKDGTTDWINQWKNECRPEAVKVYVDYQEKMKIHTISKTIAIPSGESCLP